MGSLEGVMDNQGHIGLRLTKDKIFHLAVIGISLLATLPLFCILFYVLRNGFSSLSLSFLTHLPKPPGEFGGGVSNAIVGTLLLIGFSSLVSIPFGVAIGVYLSEFQEGGFSYGVRLCVEVLQGIPSVVIGIVAYTWIVLPMKGFSLLAGTAALALIMIPVIVKASEETLKLIPYSLKEASLALGVPYYRTLFRVILPAGLSGIVTGILLSIARVAGETAPLLFTAFGNPFMNLNPLKPVNSLPLLIFNYASSPYPEWHSLAWGASFVLIFLVLSLNITSRVITKKWKVQF